MGLLSVESGNYMYTACTKVTADVLLQQKEEFHVVAGGRYMYLPRVRYYHSW